VSNPGVIQGNLNRLKASVVWALFPALNVTASFLGKGGIGLGFEGVASAQFGTMTGIVQSPEPYQPVSLTINLLKPQALSDAYKTQLELNSIIGAGTVWPDVASGGLSSYQLSNMAIQNVRELSFAGEDPSYVITLKGVYAINNALWNG